MKSIITILIFILFHINHISGQKTIKGRIIHEELDCIPSARIFDIDTVTIGETDYDGYFKVTIPEEANKLIFGFIGCEFATITLSDSCQYIELILMSDWFDGPKSNRKVDRLRKNRFVNIPNLHLLAFNKGLFIAETACYTREFVPYKPELDKIRKEIKAKKKLIKKTFRELNVEDTIEIPYSVNPGYDGTDRTTLSLYSFVVDGRNFGCIIEGVILDKNKRKNGFNLVYEVTNCDRCKYDSIIIDKRDVVVGEVFEYNMKYFKVLIE